MSALCYCVVGIMRLVVSDAALKAFDLLRKAAEYCFCCRLDCSLRAEIQTPSNQLATKPPKFSKSAYLKTAYASDVKLMLLHYQAWTGPTYSICSSQSKMSRATFDFHLADLRSVCSQKAWLSCNLQLEISSQLKW